MTEFVPSAPSPPIAQRDSTALLEDLCIALRNVANARGPRGDEMQHGVSLVLALVGELDARAVDVATRLVRLSHETGWLMPELLAECRAYPATLPRVRELDGVRRDQRCHHCGRVERPEDDVTLVACDDCVRRMIDSCDSLQPMPGTVLFRTYNEDWRCDHADADTVLLAVDLYSEGFLGPGRCKECLKQILAARQR